EHSRVVGDFRYRHQEAGVFVATRLLAYRKRGLAYLPVQTIDEPQVALNPYVTYPSHLLLETLGERARVDRDVVHEQVGVYPVLHPGPLPHQVSSEPDELPELHRLFRWHVALGRPASPQEVSECDGVD